MTRHDTIHDSDTARDHEPIVVAIDAGTTGIRAIAFGRDGHRVASAYREFTQHFPQPGWVEHDAAEMWLTTQTVLAELRAATPRRVAAIGLTNQRETLVAWSRATGAPLARAIVWQDRRTASRCDQLVAEGALEHIRRTTGLVADPYFTATKAEWMIRTGEVPLTDDLALGTVDSWLIWNLTGGRSADGAVQVTDPSNASRTMLFDINRGTWSDELCELFGVPRSALAEVKPSAGRIGATDSLCPLGAGIPISGVAGDQQAALFGQACFRPGMAKNSYGTGSFVLMNVGETAPEPVDGLLNTIAWTLPGSILGDPRDTVTHYALEGAIFVTGAAIQWLRDGLGIIESAADVGPLAESCADSGGVMVVPAFTGLGSPWWDPYARGTIVGITRGTTRAELARAVVESIAFQTRAVVDSMTAQFGHPITELRVDGGASVMQLLLERQSALLDVPVMRPEVEETTALGAAYLAGLAEGVWETTDDVQDNWVVGARVDVGRDANDEIAYQNWLRAVDRSRGWAEETN